MTKSQNPRKLSVIDHLKAYQNVYFILKLNGKKRHKKSLTTLDEIFDKWKGNSFLLKYVR